jgi:2-polyprenyl-3-methyl-5-hydroxy-6-metoxy-1,4-benzoquinol methylase
LVAPHAAVFNRYYAGYRKRFGRYVRHHYTDQTREIGVLIRQGKAPRLLEVGAGCGTEALWFALQGADVLAIDVNEERLAAARARQQVVEKALGRKLDLEFRFCSLFDLRDEAAFDLVWMEQAFHHIEPREELYPKVARLLAPGGHVVVSEANGWNLPLQARLFLLRGFKTVVERTTADGQRILYGNERITIPPVMVKGFEQHGVRPESVRYFRVLPNTRLADNLMGLERAVPSFAAPLFSHYNYVGRKAG